MLPGSTNLNDHLYRMKFVESPNCECDQSRDTIPHYLMECSLHKTNREIMMETTGKKWMENMKSGTLNINTDILIGPNFSKLISKEEDAAIKATGGVQGQKNMLILFKRFHRCGVNAFYGMSKFYSVQKLSAFQCVGPLTFL